MYVDCFSANNFAMQHKRKTIGAPDVFEAMTEMDFGQFIEPLKKNLEGWDHFWIF